MAAALPLGGCIACPKGPSCTTCANSVPLEIPLSFPWFGDRGSSTCGSTCELAEGEDGACDEVALESDVESRDSESFYSQFIDRVVVQTAATVTLSTFSVAGTAFGTIANYCLPEVALGPAEITPPGRFHPVPIRPVFAHRG
jgi:hypothetical protein